MRIGVPKEIKPYEGRVGLIPAAVTELVKRRHKVFVQSNAGFSSGYSDDEYRKSGADIVQDAAALYEAAQLVVKVKEPVEPEISLLREDHLLFGYLHLAPAPELAQRLCQIGLTAVGFETVQTSDGQLPLLAPMSDIAGRVAVQVGTHLLHQSMGGKGLLLGGLPGAERGRVVVLGAGTVGSGAASVAAALGAEVTVFDRNRDKLERMRALGPNVTGLHAYHDAIEQAVIQADLLIGAILVAGQRARNIVSADTVCRMQKGSVIADVAVDQGGCVATTRPTTYENPTYTWEGIVHFAVTNIPGAVPKSASQALSAAVLPYLLRLAEDDWMDNPELKAGINISEGKLVHPALKGQNQSQ